MKKKKLHKKLNNAYDEIEYLVDQLRDRESYWDKAYARLEQINNSLCYVMMDLEKVKLLSSQKQVEENEG